MKATILLLFIASCAFGQQKSPSNICKYVYDTNLDIHVLQNPVLAGDIWINYCKNINYLQDKMIQYYAKNHLYPVSVMRCAVLTDSLGFPVQAYILNKKNEDYTLAEKYLISILKEIPFRLLGYCNDKPVFSLFRMPVKLKIQ